MKDTIKVALFEDLFGNNNSEVYPTNAPDPILYDDVPCTRPLFVTPYTATCILEGEYNSAMYGGVYYQLKKIRMDDRKLKRIKYQLEYDVMMNLLANGGTIKGNVIRTNNEEGLSRPGVLQTCNPVLEDPCYMVYGKFVQSQQGWQKTCKLLLPDIVFKDNLPTPQTIDDFFRHLQTSEMSNRLSNVHAVVNADDIYIVSYVKNVEVLSGKNNVLDIIKEQFKNLETITLSKVTQLADSPLQAKLCLTHADASIGTTETTIQGCMKIDLSKLTDIVPKELNLKNARPSHKASYQELQPGIAKDYRPIPRNFLRKLSRKTYLPMYTDEGSNIEEEAYLPTPPNSGTHSNRVSTRYRSERPQKIILKESLGVSNPVAYLGYINKLNLCLMDSYGYLDAYSEFKYRVTADNYSGTGEADLFYTKIDDEKLPTLGFLIYQLKTIRGEGKQHLYKGAQTLTKISYRSGLTKSLFDDYRNPTGKGWDRANERGKTIRGNKEITYFSYDTDLLSGLCFAPKAASTYRYPGHKYDHGGLQSILQGRGEGYTNKYIVADIPGLEVSNPFNNDRIVSGNDRKYILLEGYSLGTNIELPYPIKTNDIFCTSLTYRITDIPPYDGSGSGTRRGYKTAAVLSSILMQQSARAIVSPFIVLGLIGLPVGALLTKLTVQTTTAIGHAELSNMKMRDLFDGDTKKTDDFGNKIVLYLRDGMYRLGYFRVYKQKLKLSDDPRQAIESVEYEKQKEVEVYHIQDLGSFDFKIQLGKPITDTQKEKIAVKAIEAAHDGIDMNIHNGTKERLLNSTILFDLEGTDGYAYFANGKVHLISKDGVDFYKVEPVLNKLIIQHSGNLPIYDKINQKATISIHGTVKTLNTKFSFEHDEFDLRVTPFLVQKANSIVDFHHVMAQNQYDYINEIIEAPKPLLEAKAEVSSAQLESLRLQIAEQNKNYYITKGLAEAQHEQKKKSFEREREDLKYSLASNIISTIGSFGETMALGLLPPLLAGKDIKSLFKLPPKSESTEYGRSKQTLMTGKYGRGLIGTGIGRMVGGFPSLARYSTDLARINEDEIAYMQQNSLEMYQRESQESFNYEKLVAQVNQMSSSYIRRDVNQGDLLAELEKQGVNRLHMEFFIPTSQQSEYLKTIFEQYGTECLVKNVELRIENFMTPTIVQFASVKKEGVISELSRDINIREMIRTLFESGVKFVDHTHVPIQQTTIEIIHPVDEPVEFDESHMSEGDSATFNSFTLTLPKNEIERKLKTIKNYGLSDEEYAKNKDQIDPEHPFEDVARIIRNRKASMTFILPPKDNRDELTKLKDKVSELEDEKGKALEDLEKQKAGYIILANAKKLLEKNIEDLEKQKKALTDQKSGVDEELRQCKINHQNVLNAKNTCDLINTNKIRELNEKIKNYEADLKVKNVELEAAKAGLTAKQIECKDISAQLAIKAALVDTKAKLLIDKEAELKAKEEVLSKTNGELLEKVKNLQLKETVITAQKSQIDDLNKTINQKTEEIQNLKKTCDDEKKTLEDNLNKTINDKTEEINTLMGTINSKDAELEQCKRSLQIASGAPDADLCRTIRELSAGFDFMRELETQQDGNTPFTKLCFIIAENLKGMRRMDVGWRLGSKYTVFAPFVQQLYKLEKNLTINKCETIIDMKGGHKYLANPTNTSDSNIRDVANALKDLRDNYSNHMSVYEVKFILDDLNWQYKLVNTAMTQEMREKDEMIDWFFKHIYPGTETTALYTQAYGVKPEVALAQREFMMAGCGTGDALKTLVARIAGTKHEAPEGDPGEKRPFTAPEFAGVWLDGTSINFWWMPYRAFFFYPTEYHLSKGDLSGSGFKEGEDIYMDTYIGGRKFYYEGQYRRCFKVHSARSYVTKKYPYTESGWKWSWAILNLARDDNLDSYRASTAIESSAENAEYVSKYQNEYTDKEIYIAVEDRKKRNAFSGVRNNQLQAGRNRKNINLSQRLKDAIEANNCTLNLIFQFPGIGRYDKGQRSININYVNLSKIFSKEDIPDVLKIFCILAYNTVAFSHRSTLSGYPNINKWVIEIASGLTSGTHTLDPTSLYFVCSVVDPGSLFNFAIKQLKYYRNSDYFYDIGDYSQTSVGIMDDGYYQIISQTR